MKGRSVKGRSAKGRSVKGSEKKESSAVAYLVAEIQTKKRARKVRQLYSRTRTAFLWTSRTTKRASKAPAGSFSTYDGGDERKVVMQVDDGKMKYIV